jgi:hypothetical protein
MKQRRRLEIIAFRRRTTIVLRDREKQSSGEWLPPSDPVFQSASDSVPVQPRHSGPATKPTFKFRSDNDENKE